VDNALYSPKFHFFQQGGQFLILHPNEDLELNSGNLQSSILEAIQKNEFSHMLAVDVKESGFNYSLQYHIDNKKPLIDMLKKDKISMKKFYQLLLKIVTVLSNSENNGLRIENFILNEKFIFIERSFTDIYFAYLPINGIAQQETFKGDLQYLTANLAKHVKDIKSKDYQKIMKQFEKSDFKIHEFQILLNELSSTFQDTYYEGKDSLSTKAKGGFSSQLRSTGIYLLIIIFGIIITSIFTWIMNPPIVEMIYLGIGIGILGLVLMGYKSLVNYKIDRTSKNSEAEESNFLNGATNFLHSNQDIGNSATVLLGGDSLTESKVFIEFINGKKIEINKDKYIIGRNSETVSYIVDAIGVSREHLQIMKLNDGGYGVMDLGSKNGTALNGRRLEPKKINIVKDQDIVSFAEEEFKVLIGL